MNQIFMGQAIKQAIKAYKKGEVPVGAIIVKNNKIIAKAYNKIEKKQNATYHAEILAIKQASKKIRNWRLLDCEMYVTLEPCEMCKNAIELSRIKKVYFSTQRDKQINLEHQKYEQIKLYEEKTTQIIKKFFENKR